MHSDNKQSFAHSCVIRATSSFNNSYYSPSNSQTTSNSFISFRFCSNRGTWYESILHRTLKVHREVILWSEWSEKKNFSSDEWGKGNDKGDMFRRNVRAEPPSGVRVPHKRTAINLMGAQKRKLTKLSDRHTNCKSPTSEATNLPKANQQCQATTPPPWISTRPGPM